MEEVEGMASVDGTRRSRSAMWTSLIAGRWAKIVSGLLPVFTLMKGPA